MFNEMISKLFKPNRVVWQNLGAEKTVEVAESVKKLQELPKEMKIFDYATVYEKVKSAREDLQKQYEEKQGKIAEKNSDQWFDENLKKIDDIEKKYLEAASAISGSSEFDDAKFKNTINLFKDTNQNGEFDSVIAYLEASQKVKNIIGKTKNYEDYEGSDANYAHDKYNQTRETWSGLETGLMLGGASGPEMKEVYSQTDRIYKRGEKTLGITDKKLTLDGILKEVSFSKKVGSIEQEKFLDDFKTEEDYLGGFIAGLLMVAKERLTPSGFLKYKKYLKQTFDSEVTNLSLAPINNEQDFLARLIFTFKNCDDWKKEQEEKAKAEPEKKEEAAVTAPPEKKEEIKKPEGISKEKPAEVRDIGEEKREISAETDPQKKYGLINAFLDKGEEHYVEDKGSNGKYEYIKIADEIYIKQYKTDGGLGWKLYSKEGNEKDVDEQAFKDASNPEENGVNTLKEKYKDKTDWTKDSDGKEYKMVDNALYRRAADASSVMQYEKLRDIENRWIKVENPEKPVEPRDDKEKLAEAVKKIDEVKGEIEKLKEGKASKEEVDKLKEKVSGIENELAELKKSRDVSAGDVTAAEENLKTAGSELEGAEKKIEKPRPFLTDKEKQEIRDKVREAVKSGKADEIKKYFEINANGVVKFNGENDTEKRKNYLAISLGTMFPDAEEGDKVTVNGREAVYDVARGEFYYKNGKGNRAIVKNGYKIGKIAKDAKEQDKAKKEASKEEAEKQKGLKEEHEAEKSVEKMRAEWEKICKKTMKDALTAEIEKRLRHIEDIETEDVRDRATAIMNLFTYTKNLFSSDNVNDIRSKVAKEAVAEMDKLFSGAKFEFTGDDVKRLLSEEMPLRVTGEEIVWGGTNGISMGAIETWLKNRKEKMKDLKAGKKTGTLEDMRTEIEKIKAEKKKEDEAKS